MAGRKKVDRAFGPKAGSVGTVTSCAAGVYSSAGGTPPYSFVALIQGEMLCFTGQCSAHLPRRFAAVRQSGQVVWLDINKVRDHVWVEGWRVPWQRFGDTPRIGLKCKT